MNLMLFEQFKQTPEYQKFIEENPSFGTLKVEAFTAFQGMPIENTEILITKDIGDNKVELVSDYNISEYKVRYIKALSPIILTVLEGVDIEGKTDITECTLHPVLHQVILDKAVELAVQSYGLTLKNQ